MSEVLHSMESVVPNLSPVRSCDGECFTNGCHEVGTLALRYGATYWDSESQRRVTEEWAAPIEEWAEGDDQLCEHHAYGMPFYAGGRFEGYVGEII